MVYVAGSSKEPERAARVAAALEAHGLAVPWKWWNGPAAPSDDRLSWTDRRDLRVGCTRAARNAVAFVLLLPPPPLLTVGAWVELGAYLGGPNASPAGLFVSSVERPASLFLQGAIWHRSDDSLIAHVALLLGCNGNSCLVDGRSVASRRVVSSAPVWREDDADLWRLRLECGHSATVERLAGDLPAAVDCDTCSVAGVEL